MMQAIAQLDEGADTRPDPGDQGGPPARLEQVLATLHCPYCGSNLSHDPAAAAGFGLLRCACHTYPIVDAIPILRQIEGLETVVDSVRRGETQEALVQALKLFRVNWSSRSRWHKFIYRRHVRRLVTQAGLTFQDAVELVRKPRSFADYLIHRYANPSFLATAGLLQVFASVAERASKDRPPTVIDLGCGAGHSSFLLRHLFPNLSVVAADHDFVSVYLARRFVAPGAIHLCIDAEVPSPFADHSFDGIFCLDAFHYLRTKKTVVSELRRVAAADAVWLFPHLHNALQHNPVAGIPMSPVGYRQLFDVPNARFFDEKELLGGLTRGTLDLRAEPAGARLDAASTLVLAAGPDQLWRVHSAFPGLLCRDRSRLTINPIYSRAEAGDTIQLTLTWPNPGMRDECRGAEAVLPLNYRMSRQALQRALRGEPEPSGPRLEELVARFILVALPPNYVAACDRLC